VNARRQCGVILMSALILMALAAIVAAALFFDTAMSARRSVASFSMEQSLQLAQGAEALAAYALKEDKSSDDTPLDEWAKPYGPVEVEAEVTLEALLTDEEGKFNLNTLVKADGTANEEAGKIFRRILELLEMEPRWASLAVDYIDPNVLPESDGGEDSTYTSLRPPHRVGNLNWTSVSELMQLPGMTRELYLRVLPHVTALPPDHRTVNVCMAQGIVLDALFAVSKNNASHIEYSRLSADEMLRNRQNGCYPKRSVLAANEPDMAAWAAERSHYFRLHSWIRIGTAQFALYSLMYRDDSGQVRPLLRSFGTE
jgi:general secretion pathway protein K